jgi:hypothetical protein
VEEGGGEWGGTRHVEVFPPKVGPCGTSGPRGRGWITPSSRGGGLSARVVAVCHGDSAAAQRCARLQQRLVFRRAVHHALTGLLVLWHEFRWVAAVADSLAPLRLRSAP